MYETLRWIQVKLQRNDHSQNFRSLEKTLGTGFVMHNTI